MSLGIVQQQLSNAIEDIKFHTTFTTLNDLNRESRILPLSRLLLTQVTQHNYHTCILCYLHSQWGGWNNFLERLLQNQEVYQFLDAEEI